MKFSVIGSQVNNSLSPALHSWIYKNLNLDHQYEYIRLSEDSVDNIVDKINKNKLSGANITMPFKESIISDIDELDDISRDLMNYDLEFRIQELESKFSIDMSETTFNELKELKKKQNLN